MKITVVKDSIESADLIIVKGNPATNISDIEKVEIVFKDGVGYGRREIDPIGAGGWWGYDDHGYAVKSRTALDLSPASRAGKSLGS